MNKRKSVDKLNRTSSHRKAMLRNMATSLFEHERIVTTRAKAKTLRSYAEVLITRARKLSQDKISTIQALHHRRLLLRYLRGRTIVKKLMEDIAPRFVNRPGGYLRIIHLPSRKSDATEMSIVELIERKEKIKRVGVKEKSAPKKKDTENTPLATNKKVAGSYTVQGVEKSPKKWFGRLRRP